MADGEPSPGELGRGLQSVLERFEDLARKIETSYVTKEVFNLTLQIRTDAEASLAQRIEKLESNQTWLVRTVVGALLTGAIGWVLWARSKGL